jgi:hypothetical protein
LDELPQGRLLVMDSIFSCLEAFLASPGAIPLPAFPSAKHGDREVGLARLPHEVVLRARGMKQEGNRLLAEMDGNEIEDGVAAEDRGELRELRDFQTDRFLEAHEPGVAPQKGVGPGPRSSAYS